jgi:hypothetical protein
MLMNADEMIDEEMIQSIKEEESWEKVAKKVLSTSIIDNRSLNMESQRSIFLPSAC